MMGGSSSKAPQIKNILYEELSAKLSSNKGNFVLIDVRNPDELVSQGAIPGAVNIPLPQVDEAFKKLSDEEFKAQYGFDKMKMELIFSCRSGMRAEKAANCVTGLISPDKISLYKGSFMDWEAKGGAIKK